MRQIATSLDVAALLAHVENAPPIEAVDAVAVALAEMLGAQAVAFLIADFSGRAVVRLTTAGPAVEGARSQGEEQAETLPLSGTPYEQVLRTQQPDVRAIEGGARLVVPVTDRGDAIGLLEVTLPLEPTPDEVAAVANAAHALAYIVIAARRFTDVFEWGQRTTPFSLAAEIQRRLLPHAYTCEAGQFTLSGWLEPAASVGGDTFDYALERSSLQLSISDAVGHDVSSSLLATLLVGALRNARRRGLTLADQARRANADVAANGTPGQFVTGQLVRIDLGTGAAEIVNAGHPRPLLLRHGEVGELPLTVEPPFGVQPGRAFRPQPLSLEPGDRLVLLTDGMLERNAASLDVAKALRETAHLHPRQVVQELGAAVVRVTGGDLRDDATLLCLDWYGGPPRLRESDHGADRARASPPAPGDDLSATRRGVHDVRDHLAHVRGLGLSQDPGA